MSARGVLESPAWIFSPTPTSEASPGEYRTFGRGPATGGESCEGALPERSNGGAIGHTGVADPAGIQNVGALLRGFGRRQAERSGATGGLWCSAWQNMGAHHGQEAWP